MKIAVYAIAKNEAKHVERFLRSVHDADEVVVLDTGSTDETVDLLRAYGATVFERAFSPWSFAAARNAALDLVSDDVDLCLCLDLDETMGDGWREALEAVWTPGVTRVCYPFIADHNRDGSPATTFTRNLCHSRRGYQWQWPVHECIMPLPGTVESVVSCAMACHHWPDAGKSRGSYLPLLAQAVQDMPDDPRMAYYYARELEWYGKRDEARDAFLRYLGLHGGYLAERAEAYRLLARCFGDEAQRGQALLHAVAEDPHRRDQWVDLAWWYFGQRRYAEAYGAAQAALRLTDRHTGFMTYAPAWGSHIYEVAAYSAYYLGLYDEAKRLAEAGLACNDGNDHFAKQAEEWLGVTP